MGWEKFCLILIFFKLESLPKPADAKSLAIPLIPKQSGLFGVIDISIDFSIDISIYVSIDISIDASNDKVIDAQIDISIDISADTSVDILTDTIYWNTNIYPY